jgi:hypothetical protein
MICHGVLVANKISSEPKLRDELKDLNAPKRHSRSISLVDSLGTWTVGLQYPVFLATNTSNKCHLDLGLDACSWPLTSGIQHQAYHNVHHGRNISCLDGCAHLHSDNDAPARRLTTCRCSHGEPIPGSSSRSRHELGGKPGHDIDREAGGRCNSRHSQRCPWLEGITHPQVTRPTAYFFPSSSPSTLTATSPFDPHLRNMRKAQFPVAQSNTNSFKRLHVLA